MFSRLADSYTAIRAFSAHNLIIATLLAGRFGGWNDEKWSS